MRALRCVVERWGARGTGHRRVGNNEANESTDGGCPTRMGYSRSRSCSERTGRILCCFPKVQGLPFIRRWPGDVVDADDRMEPRGVAIRLCFCRSISVCVCPCLKNSAYAAHAQVRTHTSSVDMSCSVPNGRSIHFDSIARASILHLSAHPLAHLPTELLPRSLGVCKESKFPTAISVNGACDE